MKKSKSKETDNENNIHNEEKNTENNINYNNNNNKKEISRNKINNENTNNNSTTKRKKVVRKKKITKTEKIDQNINNNNSVENINNIEKNNTNENVNITEENIKPKIKKKKKKLLTKVKLIKKDSENSNNNNNNKPNINSSVEEENNNDEIIQNTNKVNLKLKPKKLEKENFPKKRKISKKVNEKNNENEQLKNTFSEDNIFKKPKINNSKNQTMRIVQNENTAAFLIEKESPIYIDEKTFKSKNDKKNIINNIDTFELDYTKSKLNRSVEGFNTYQNHKKYDEEIILYERSNSFKKMRNFVKFNEREKINSVKFENGVSCILEINKNIFSIGNLIGDIIIFNNKSLKEIQTIREHDGTVISLCLLHDKGILSCSADRTMKKIRISANGQKYIVEFIFEGYENYILKGIELMNSYKIVTCSWDDKLFVWDFLGPEYEKKKIFNRGERVQDILEINTNYFVSISDNNDLKFWNSENFELIDVINNIKCIGAPNALCKLNDVILSVLDYHEIQLVDLSEKKLINNIMVDDGNLSCIIKLNDNSLLVAEDFNTDTYCVFYMKQFYYDQGDLQPVSYKKDKFYKSNKNNDKEIRALVQFSNGIIVQGVTGEYNGKDSGDLFFYY